MLLASVIVPARNAERTLPRTLAALQAQELDGDYEVIVVDDGSRDGTARAAKAAGGPVTAVEQPPSGPAAARNLGAANARADALAFCDADVYPTPGWLAAGTEALGHADVVQGKVLPDPGASLGPYDRTIWVTRSAGLYETANLFVRRETFERVGGFEEWFRPGRGKAMAEDMWFAYRALRLGAAAAFCEDALAYHEVFRRDWRAYVRERARLEYFPAMARKMPELRSTFLYRRVFLNQRSARFDLAMLALAAALGSGSSIPLSGALPYAKTLWGDAGRAAEGRTSVAAADLAADLVGIVALLAGSARYRSPLF